jgi:hypothetical protein
MTLTGGCQCGAVRFRVEGELGRATLCHCRMCQKAFGAPYGALVTARMDQLVWTRGQRRRFQSSNLVWRGFCETCGTPLTYERSETTVELAVCAFDAPASIPIAVQFAIDTALPWAAPPAVPIEPESAAAQGPPMVSYQHPDHDTPVWPPR